MKNKNLKLAFASLVLFSLASCVREDEEVFQEKGNPVSKKEIFEKNNILSKENIGISNKVVIDTLQTQNSDGTTISQLPEPETVDPTKPKDKPW